MFIRTMVRLFGCPIALTLVGALFVPELVTQAVAKEADPSARPNVILLVTDDQGYGDIHAHGNEMIQTPCMDRLHDQSVRLTDFHVDPTCAPTRAALMTGRYSTRVGVWHTVMGRSQLRADEVTMADVFQNNGYATGMFGKWHLGDNYPFRPHDRGFDEALFHGGGGVSQQLDYWGNDYFDDTYFAGHADGDRNVTTEKCEGYCTDVWFDRAIDFIRRNKAKEKPFFCYLATNAPHRPLFVAEKYWKPYAEKGVPEPMARFYGMITNIDENLGRLRKELKNLGLEENTILVFMSDNGTADGVGHKDPKRGRDAKGGWHGFNAGMRAQKGSYYDGGHRVPCFIYWPGGGFDHAAQIDEISAHVDLLPTLIDMLGLQPHEKNKPFDGKSLVPLFDRHLKQKKVDWPDRELFAEVNRLEQPPKWKRNTVMTDRWRLVEDRELYDIQADPGQKKNVIAKHPDVAKRLHDAYEARWPGLTARAGEYTRSILGSDAENPTTLCSHDWHPTTGPISPWDQTHVKDMVPWNGFWAVHVDRPATYRITLRHRPAQEKFPLQAATARLQVGKTPETMDSIASVQKPVPKGATEVSFEVSLPAGDCFLQTWLDETSGVSRGAYYVEVERLKESASATEPIGGYLFAHMTKKEYGRLYYSISPDGMKWEPLNNGKRVLEEYRGHPEICRGHDGRYYLIGNTETGPHIRIWVSSDLIDWQPLKTFRADFSAIPEFEMTSSWHGAPKMFYDDRTEQYIITWHIDLKEKDPNTVKPYWEAMRTLYILSKDLKTFSKPKRLFPFDMPTIDTIIHREGDTYYAFLKEVRWPQKSPTGKTIRICTAPSLTGPWSEPSKPVSPPWREAPTLIPKRDRSGWFLYYEKYPGIQYDCSTAPTLGGPWHYSSDKDAQKYIAPEGSRHGCMIPISQAEYDAICKRFANYQSKVFQ